MCISIKTRSCINVKRMRDSGGAGDGAGVSCLGDRQVLPRPQVLAESGFCTLEERVRWQQPLWASTRHSADPSQHGLRAQKCMIQIMRHHQSYFYKILIRDPWRSARVRVLPYCP
jgi:hypothetical protein